MDAWAWAAGTPACEYGKDGAGHDTHALRYRRLEAFTIRWRRPLAAPLHYHHNEDEYSYVLSGTLGALLGDEVVKATPGTWVFKPRHQMAHLLERRRRAL